MATVVEPDWLLTAAHCMGGESVDLKTALHLEVPYQVEQIFVHPESDIALVQLKTPVRYGKPATLYNQTDEVGKDRKSTRLNSSHVAISYAVFCLKKKRNI